MELSGRLPKALIVDDSGATRERLKMILEKCGFYPVWNSTTGVEAIERCKALRPELVVINVPDIIGVETVKWILDMDNTIKILVMGRPGQESYIGEAMMAGAVDYFMETLGDDEIAHMILRIF
jgi:two-component system chemotaxis response regulator CheY